MSGSTSPALPDGYRALIESDRVSTRTRQVLMTRLDTPVPDGPALDGPVLDGPVLDGRRIATLRAVIARVVPQGGEPIDLAGRVAAALEDGDGWRVATQPPDVVAYRDALEALNRVAGAEGSGSFGQLPQERQDALLRLVATGTALPGPGGPLSPEQMQVWFEDLRSDAVRAYVADPRTLARMGFSGIGYGGDGERLQGFAQVGMGAREAWEPIPGHGGVA